VIGLEQDGRQPGYPPRHVVGILREKECGVQPHFSRGAFLFFGLNELCMK
jgi:hypothetical protein